MKPLTLLCIKSHQTLIFGVSHWFFLNKLTSSWFSKKIVSRLRIHILNLNWFTLRLTWNVAASVKMGVSKAFVFSHIFNNNWNCTLGIVNRVLTFHRAINHCHRNMITLKYNLYIVVKIYKINFYCSCSRNMTA